jgi:hypothetical protein
MAITRSIAVVAVALALSACATKWVKPGAGEQDLLADQTSCEQDAEAAFANDGSRLKALTTKLDKKGAFERCMIARGWRDKDGKIASVQATPAARSTQPLYLPGYSR